MMLRASNEQTDITVITKESEDANDGGVRHGRLLIDLVDAVLDRDDGDPAHARRRLEEAAGPDLVVEAGAVMGMFELNDRVADATGVPLDEFGLDIRLKVGDKLGISRSS